MTSTRSSKPCRSSSLEEDRDPASLALSVHIWTENLDPARSAGASLHREVGVDRVMAIVRARSATMGR
jgi:hypothetical protein